MESVLFSWSDRKRQLTRKTFTSRVTKAGVGELGYQSSTLQIMILSYITHNLAYLKINVYFLVTHHSNKYICTKSWCWRILFSEKKTMLSIYQLLMLSIIEHIFKATYIIFISFNVIQSQSYISWMVREFITFSVKLFLMCTSV